MTLGSLVSQTASLDGEAVIAGVTGPACVGWSRSTGRARSKFRGPVEVSDLQESFVFTLLAHIESHFYENGQGTS